MIDEARRGCACIYRLAFQPPDASSGRIYRVKVAVGGRALPFRYRVRFLDEIDRWWRSAQAVLANPENFADVAVSVAIVPLAASRDGWDLKVQVALDVASLMLFPAAGKQRGEWEVGAFLARNDGRRKWEMIGNSSLLRESEPAPGAFVVHERRFDGLKPGSYRLRAFVRDRGASGFGGAETAIDLPPPGMAGLAGPILVRSHHDYVSSPLPLLDEQAADARADGASEGPVPVGDLAVPPGESLEARAWICPGGDRPPRDDELARFISVGGQPLFRLEPQALERAGDCFSLSDRIETTALTGGEYGYRLHWRPDSGEPVERELVFRVGQHEMQAGVQASEAVRTPDEPVTLKSPARGGHAAEEPEPNEFPDTRSPRMTEILERVANAAQLYRDNALRFTCDETIHYSGYGAPIRHKFRYLYRYSKADDALRDYRVPRSGKFDPDVDRVDLESYGLPVFMLRAYSWLFIFFEGNQELYRFKLAGEEQVLRRPAERIDFEPIPPYESEVNDWFGSAWVDRETYQLLRVEAVRLEDREQQRLAEIAARQGGKGYKGSYPVAHYSTDFDVEKNGMRFPGRVLIEGTQLHVHGGQIVEAPVFHVKQTYKGYRFFGVRTAEEIRERTRGGQGLER